MEHKIHRIAAWAAGGSNDLVARQRNSALLGGQAVLQPHVRVGASADQPPVAAEPVRVCAAIKCLRT